MKILVNGGMVAVILAITGCSGLQVQRDLKHSQLSEQYRTSLNSASAFDANRQCTATGSLNAWSTLDFSPATAITLLPNGVKASAACFRIPSNARIVQLHADAKGGMTYHELAIVHPSLLFIDGNNQLVRDIQKPKLSPGESFFSGLGLSGNVVIETSLASAKYVVVYIHPLSLDGAIDVQTGYESIPVPYSPYGQVKIRFK